MSNYDDLFKQALRKCDDASVATEIKSMWNDCDPRDSNRDLPTDRPADRRYKQYIRDVQSLSSADEIIAYAEKRIAQFQKWYETTFVDEIAAYDKRQAERLANPE